LREDSEVSREGYCKRLYRRIQSVHGQHVAFYTG